MDFVTGKEIEIPDDIRRLLQSNEEILLSTQQARSPSLVNPNAVFVTTRGVIVQKPNTLALRKNIEHYEFVDIVNVQLRRGIIRSGIILKMIFLSDYVEIDNFPNEVGEKIFKLVEDGISGRLTSRQPGEEVIKKPNVLQQEIIDKIKELSKLKDQGILSDMEFQSKKAELLETL
jgi:hypothetical protein